MLFYRRIQECRGYYHDDFTRLKFTIKHFLSTVLWYYLSINGALLAILKNAFFT